MIKILLSNIDDLTSFGTKFKVIFIFSTIVSIIVSIVFLSCFDYISPVVLIAGGFLAGFSVTFVNIVKYLSRYKNFYNECVSNNIDDPSSEKNHEQMKKIAYNYLPFIDENLEDAYLIGKGEKRKPSNSNSFLLERIKENKVVIIGVIIALIVAYFMAEADVGKRKWSDLTEQEKQEAEWAYEMKEFIDDYKENNN